MREIAMQVDLKQIEDACKELYIRALKLLPPDIKVALLFDQSVFVRAAIADVLREACIAAGLDTVRE